MSTVLSVQNMTKLYVPVRALNEVSFEVPKGSVFGILGPNGSGKTTLLGIVMDILRPTKGTYLWNGKPGSNEQRRQIGTLLETPNLFQRKDSKFSTYSLGMKQRLAIASTLLGDPNILVFDEPTNGLDPAGIAEIRQLIRDLNKQGKTIIMASHILDEVEKVCTHVAIIQNGVLKEKGTVQDVLSGTTGDTIATV